MTVAMAIAPRSLKLKSPFPYFGGKSRIARAVWQRFGRVRNYVEPFCGLAAMLMCRPQPFEGTETVNDADGFICNFWRAVQSDPDSVARYADWPVNENDLHARHAWLVERRDSLASKLEGDPEYFDAKIAAWWCWGQCCWIAGGWCSGRGPWKSIVMDDGSRQLANLGSGRGVNRQLANLGSGRGVNRQRVHLVSGQGVNRNLVNLGDNGRGVKRQRVHLGSSQGVNRPGDELREYFAELADRLRRVRVCCGDWSRVCGPTPTVKMGLTGVFLDPPYSAMANRNPDCYSMDSLSVACDVRKWAIEHGDDPRLRIALCGYDGEHDIPDSWECLKWKTSGGYGTRGQGETRGKVNAKRERIWFSPHCLNPD